METVGVVMLNSVEPENRDRHVNSIRQTDRLHQVTCEPMTIQTERQKDFHAFGGCFIIS